MTVIEEIAAERARQITHEDYDHAHDDKHRDGEIAMAAATYAAGIGFSGLWPADWGFPKYDMNPRRNYIKAAALLVAEIERIDRAKIEAEFSAEMA